jgi:HK97 family phage prohead protease
MASEAQSAGTATREALHGATMARCDGCGQMHDETVLEAVDGEHQLCPNCVDNYPDGNPVGQYPPLGRSAGTTRGYETREAALEVTPSRNGRNLDGYAAVFNTRTRIPDRGGDFDEELKPGFADRSLRELGPPVMQYDHGRDPRVGTVPVGLWTEWRADGKGYRVRGHLFDNDLVEPVRQALAEGALNGLSFRFKVAKGGDKWERRHGGPDLRHVHDADVHEAGPVVFPAYKGARVSIRSAGLMETVERHYGGYDGDLAEPRSLDEILKMMEAMTGLSTQRALDRIEAENEARSMDARAHREHLLQLARGEKRARRQADLAYMAFVNGWVGGKQSHMDEYVRFDREARQFGAELRDACLQDEALVAGIRRRVAS